MLTFIGKIILKLYGWKIDDNFDHEALKRSVIIASPHTSNWDYVMARAAFGALGIKLRYTIKDEFMRFPLNLFFGPLGGIGINRRPKVEGQPRQSMVDAIIELFNKNKELTLMITPEGTRSLRTKWKTGFYYIAKGADVPIGLGYLDFEKKIAGINKVIYPIPSLEEVMIETVNFYKDVVGKHPDKFSVDLEYLEKAKQQ